jgi:hypothetical protein
MHERGRNNVMMTWQTLREGDRDESPTCICVEELRKLIQGN